MGCKAGQGGARRPGAAKAHGSVVATADGGRHDAYHGNCLSRSRARLAQVGSGPGGEPPSGTRRSPRSHPEDGRMGCRRRSGGNDGAVGSMLLASCDERLRGWSAQIEAESGKRLPESAEVLATAATSRWRTMQPREAFHSAYVAFCETPITASVREYWDGTARIVREASRSREIIDYWRGAAGQGEEGQALLEEARNNAAHVLAEQLQVPTSTENLESTLAHTFRIWEQEGSTVLEAAQMGWVRLLRLPRGRRLSNAVVREGRRRATTSVHRAARWGNDQWQRGLEVIGGKLPERPAAIPVLRRTTLRDTLFLPSSKSELPA